MFHLSHLRESFRCRRLQHCKQYCNVCIKYCQEAQVDNQIGIVVGFEIQQVGISVVSAERTECVLLTEFGSCGICGSIVTPRLRIILRRDIPNLVSTIDNVSGFKLLSQYGMVVLGMGIQFLKRDDGFWIVIHEKELSLEDLDTVFSTDYFKIYTLFNIDRYSPRVYLAYS